MKETNLTLPRPSLWSQPAASQSTEQQHRVVGDPSRYSQTVQYDQMLYWSGPWVESYYKHTFVLEVKKGPDWYWIELYTE